MEFNTNGSSIYIRKGKCVFQATGGKVRLVGPFPTRINSYSTLQKLGEFTDKEMTILRLKIGHIITIESEYKASRPYSANRYYKYTLTPKDPNDIATLLNKGLKNYCATDAAINTKEQT